MAARPPRLAPGGSLGRSVRRLTAQKRCSSLPSLPIIPEAEPEPPEPAAPPTAAAPTALAAPPAAKRLLAEQIDDDAGTIAVAGVSALVLAMTKGAPGALRQLLAARADVGARDAEGRALAHLWGWSLLKSRSAVREEHLKLAALAEYGADLNAMLPGTGDTPLHVLARVFNCVCLASSGASVPTTAAAQLPPEEAAKFAKSTRCRMQLLLDARADPVLCNASGRTPLDLVDEPFRSSVAALRRSAPGAGAAGTGCSPVFEDDSTSWLD